MKTLALIILIFFTPFTFNQKSSIEGKWIATKAINEDGKPCDKKTINAFTLSFLPNNKYIGDGQILANGTYSLSKTILKLNEKLGQVSYSFDIPVKKLQEDIMILDFNLCATHDTITHSTLELKRIK